MNFRIDRGRTLAIGTGAIALVLILTSLRQFSAGESAQLPVLFQPVATVQQEPFDIRVNASAELDAARSILLSSELPGNQAKVVFLVAEGTLVEAGDSVARFDSTSFEQALADIGHKITEQEAKLQQAQADLALHEHGSKDRAAQLEHNIEVSRLKLDSMDQASIPLRIAQAEKALRRAAAELDRAKQLQQTERELIERGLTPQSALDEAEVKYQDAMAAHDLARHQLRVLNEVTLPAERRQAELQWQNAEREVKAFQQAYLENRKKLQAAAAQIENRIQSLHLERERNLRYLDQTELRAPVSGLVLYKTISIQGEKRKVQVGDSLWQHQGFAVIPDLSSMVAVTDIGESQVGKLQPGQAVTVFPTAWPELALAGTVGTVGTLAGDGTSDAERHFRVRIALAQADPRLRPGMSARASILVQRRETATLIPVEAIFYHRQEPVVFLWHDGHPLRTSVTLGLSDGERVVVEQGLSKGQQVMLARPDNFTVQEHAEG